MNMPVSAVDPGLLLPGKAIIHYQLAPAELVAQVLERKEGLLSDTGALCINTGIFTGRSPNDKYIVHDALSSDTVDWNKFNTPIKERDFLQLRNKMLRYLGIQDEVWVRDCYACADSAHRIKIRVMNETPSANLFCYNMFLRPETHDFTPDWLLIQAPGFIADPATDGTRSKHFVIISFTHQTVLIGGTGYTGEMKKSIFSVLNYLLPVHKNILPMHCSANVGKKGDVAIFFGLSGTGKTTLSADPSRKLIGDDEHGWDENGVFNFEGGCYAKTIGLSKEKEPAIYEAICDGTLVENVCFSSVTNTIDFDNKSITENTRASYPLHYIGNSLEPSVAGHPTHIFFLTCDAFGVLPPISKLNAEQAMYQFISGYTARVAGTETGVTEPKVTFSACFGAPFLPLHPRQYAALLKERIDKYNVQVWMINTGWSGGAYGAGQRMPLQYTRAMLSAVLNNELHNVAFEQHDVFDMLIPKSCLGVPAELLNPCNTWADKSAYYKSAQSLLQLFKKNADTIA